MCDLEHDLKTPPKMLLRGHLWVKVRIFWADSCHCRCHSCRSVIVREPGWSLRRTGRLSPRETGGRRPWRRGWWRPGRRPCGRSCRKGTGRWKVLTPCGRVWDSRWRRGLERTRNAGAWWEFSERRLAAAGTSTSSGSVNCWSLWWYWGS